jgi:hypothetical protein
MLIGFIIGYLLHNGHTQLSAQVQVQVGSLIYPFQYRTSMNFPPKLISEGSLYKLKGGFVEIFQGEFRLTVGFTFHGIF